jgi:hypothetical protein
MFWFKHSFAMRFVQDLECSAHCFKVKPAFIFGVPFLKRSSTARKVHLAREEGLVVLHAGR